MKRFSMLIVLVQALVVAVLFAACTTATPTPTAQPTPTPIPTPTSTPSPTITYTQTRFQSGSASGKEISVAVGASVDAYVTLDATATMRGELKVEVWKAIAPSSDTMVLACSEAATLAKGIQEVSGCQFTADELINRTFTRYYLKTYWNGVPLVIAYHENRVSCMAKEKHVSGLDDLVLFDKSLIEPAATVLARAFWGYPLVRYSFPKESEREKRTRYFFEFTLSYGIRYGEVYASSRNLEGIAVWLPSDSLPFTYWRLLRSGALLRMFKMGRHASRRMQPIGEHIDATHERLAPFRHWYLLNLGVDPGFRKQGFSGKLVRPMLERLRGEGLACYVDTLDEQNVYLYEHFGFELLEKSVVPGTDLYCWALLKKPQTRG